MPESPFVYTEDRNPETGHGWRDLPPETITFEMTQIGEMTVRQAEDEWGRQNPADCSYAWITRRDCYENEGGFFAKDELYEDDILSVHTEFGGGSDMEGHFEFEMTPEEMQEHLESLGIHSTGKVARD